MRPEKLRSQPTNQLKTAVAFGNLHKFFKLLQVIGRRKPSQLIICQTPTSRDVSNDGEFPEDQLGWFYYCLVFYDQ